MSGNADLKETNLLPFRGLTRRGFIQTASVSAAGAALAGGCASEPRHDHPGGDHHLYGPARPTSIAVDRVRNLAVTSDDDKRVILWDVSGQPGRVDTFKDHDRKASFVAIAQGKVFSASYDGRVFVTDLSSTNRQSPRGIFTRHRDECGPETEVWVVAAAEQGNRAVSATNGGQILLWRHDTSPPQKLGEFRESDEPVGGLAFVDRAGHQLLSTHGHGKVVLWNVSDPALPRKVQEFSHGNSHAVNSVSASPDGGVVASGSFDMTVLLWDAASGKRLLQQPIRHDDWVWRVAFSPDKKHVASASQDGTVRVWDAAAGGEVKRFDVGEGGSMGVAWLDDGTVIYTGNGTGDPVRKGQL